MRTRVVPAGAVWRGGGGEQTEPDPESWYRRWAFSRLNLTCFLSLVIRKGGFHCAGSRRVFLSNPAGAGEPREEPERHHGVRGLRHPREHRSRQWEPGGPLFSSSRSSQKPLEEPLRARLLKATILGPCGTHWRPDRGCQLSRTPSWRGEAAVGGWVVPEEAHTIWWN